MGRRLRIDVVDGQLVAQGVNTGDPDGAPDVRQFTGAVHDHWKNFHLPQLPTPNFAQTFLPEFDVQPSVTSLQNHSLSLQLDNLVWDRILGLDLFPDSVFRMEMDYYKKIQNRYGLPLDNRRDYTKLDWILWPATLTKDPADFQALVSPVHRFLNDTPDRSPMTDWYETKSGKKVGFTARPVVGGVYLQVLHRDDLWNKWAKSPTSVVSRILQPLLTNPWRTW